MKRILALTALAAASSAALAQSSVTVYGILDAGVSQVTGIRGGSRTFLVSGIMDGSRLGFRGNEDLGGGYRAIFTMEHRMEVDTGGISNRPLSGLQLPDRLSDASLMGLPTALQPIVTNVSTSLATSAVGVNLANNMWDRQVYVGLVTPFGAGLAGRQYTPAYEVSAAFDTLGTQSSLAAGQVAAFPASIDIRISNAVAYRIAQGPFSAALMYGLGEGSATTGRLIGGMAMYKTDRFGVGVGYNTRENERGEKSLTSAVLGGSLALGPGTVSALYAGIKDDHPSNLTALETSLAANPQVGPAIGAIVTNAYRQALRQDARLMHIGYKMVTGPHTIYVATSTLDDKRPANADTTSYGVAYTYSLSKRTDINAVATHFNNKNLAQALPGQAGFVGGVTDKAGTDSNSVALGLRHRF